MSIQIDKAYCRKCGQCMEVCPGNLIARDTDGQAFLRYPEECWGCASCLKECRYGAISYYLGGDIGGHGAQMQVRYENDLCHWTVRQPGRSPVTITVDRRKANNY